jgi:hypothetical protein
MQISPEKVIYRGAMAKEKMLLPIIPSRAWFALREKFKQSIPSKVDADYIASILSISKQSATNNILPALRKTGIIGDDGTPTEKARRWRDDSQYGILCNELLKEIYPNELISMSNNPDKDKEQLKSWLKSKTGIGESAAGKIIQFYVTLYSGNIQPQEEQAANKSRPRITKKKQVPPGNSSPDVPSDKLESKISVSPSININLQIHFSADMPDSKIDKIMDGLEKLIRRNS